MAAIKRDVICLKIDCVTANCIIIASLKYVCALLHRYSNIFWTVQLCLYLGGFSSLPYRINVIPNEKQFYFFVSPTEKRIIVAKKKRQFKLNVHSNTYSNQSYIQFELFSRYLIDFVEILSHCTELAFRTKFPPHTAISICKCYMRR